MKEETAHAREAATRDILEVISQSRDDERPVFDMILRNAARLCKAPIAQLVLIHPSGTNLVQAASHGEALPSIKDGDVWPMDPMGPVTRSIREARVFHTHDLAGTDGYRRGDTEYVQLVDTAGLRTELSVPLIRDGEGFGAVTLSRRVVEPFDGADIALVETFAAQAVIAIENVRQFRELQTRLDREKASAAILDVISQNRDDEGPVFDTILFYACQLCDAQLAFIVQVDASGQYIGCPAHRGCRPAFAATLEVFREPLATCPLSGAVTIRERRVIRIDDIADDDLYRSGEPNRVDMVELEGIRSLLVVPMLGGNRDIGSIVLYRREVAPFSDEDEALVETFAAQAVVAIENVRQFQETRAALARQTASAEVLRAISKSPDDTNPVFDAIVTTAIGLLGSDMALVMMSDGATFTPVSGATPNGLLDDLGPRGFPVDPSLNFPSRAFTSRAYLHLPDWEEIDLPDHERAIQNLLGIKSTLYVPLLREAQIFGLLIFARCEARAFTPEEIEIALSFCDQAVIAIENVRLFRELQERLEREAATRDILEVISQNRDDDRPVFDVIVQNAARLCGAAVCTLWRVENGRIHYCASQGLYGEDLAEAELTPEEPLVEDPLSDNTVTGRVFRTRAVARIDAAADESYIDHEWALARGLKYLVGVPIFVGGEVWGSINPMWPLDRPPRDADIQLVESFAAQAAIAIENVRQFKALEALNAELGNRVEEQVVEIERMGRLKRFLPAAVADAVVSSGSEKMLSSHRALLGVLFCDIRGFTAFCETAEPEETIEVLQTYHEEMGKLIDAHGAGVDHRIGDGIMVLFNDPLPCDDPAGNAVRLALAMRARMAELCQRWKKMGHRLGFGVGVSLGYATVGMVGSGGRFDYTASGTAINLASRLADEALDGEILLSPRARTAVEDQFPVELRGEVTLKGIREPVEVFRLTGIAVA